MSVILVSRPDALPFDAMATPNEMLKSMYESGLLPDYNPDRNTHFMALSHSLRKLDSDATFASQHVMRGMHVKVFMRRPPL